MDQIKWQLFQELEQGITIANSDMNLKDPTW